MANQKHIIITQERLSCAIADVQRELDAAGVLTDELSDVPVRLTWFGTAYGYQYYRSSGHIEIPAISLCRLGEWLRKWPRATLRDILRHEYAHAIADQNRGLIRSIRFREAFGTPHDSCTPSEYCPTKHVTPYAATNSSEDFAEVFMYYLKHRYQLPMRFNAKSIRRKWSFVEQLCGQISLGRRQWA